MKISQKAKENHNELLPNHESKLKETDPEFIEIYDNFAFDEVLEHSTLPKRSRMLVTLATLITNQSINEYKIMIKGAMNLGLTPIEIKETLLKPNCLDWERFLERIIKLNLILVVILI